MPCPLSEEPMNFRKAKDAANNPACVAIATYLRANGPTAGDDLAVAVGLTPERFWVAIQHPWFIITGKGWDLSELGQRESGGVS